MQPGQIGPLSHRRAVAWATRLALCLAVHGCSTATGGAVELSWKLKAASSSPMDFIDCPDPNAVGWAAPTQIQLNWQSGATAGSASWTCSLAHGVTGFELQPGEALLWVIPICENGPANIETYTAPAKVQRTVIAGETIDLNAVEIIIQVTACDHQPCICQ